MNYNFQRLLTGLFYFNVTLTFLGCTKLAETSSVDSSPTPQAVSVAVLPTTATLRNSASFPIGSAIDDYPLKAYKQYAQIAGDEFSSVTPESAMKFDRVEWKRNNFDFSAGDAIVNFATLHNQRVHGHTLVWKHALPEWVKNFSGDSAAWESILKTHIQAVVSHYKGKVKSWDVVNEAIDDNDGSLVNKDKYGPGSGSLWTQHLGTNYIVRAFRYAHEADPGALLFYNDYGNDNGGWNTTKIKSVIAIVNSIKNSGGTISGIGIQMHVNLTTDNNNIAASLKQLAATGLLIHISELDVSVNPSNNPNFVYTDSFKALQSNKYQSIAEIYRASVPKAQQFGITTWEFSDAYSEPTLSGKKDYRLLFDLNYQKKAAYDGYFRGLTN
jgi:endo-1,4-beta-xylanase